MQAAEVAAIPAVTGGMVHPWTEGMEPLIAMAPTTEAIHQIVVIATGTKMILFPCSDFFSLINHMQRRRFGLTDMLYVVQLKYRHPKKSSKTEGLPIAHGYSSAQKHSREIRHLVFA